MERRDQALRKAEQSDKINFIDIDKYAQVVDIKPITRWWRQDCALYATGDIIDEKGER